MGLIKQFDINDYDSKRHSANQVCLCSILGKKVLGIVLSFEDASELVGPAYDENFFLDKEVVFGLLDGKLHFPYCDETLLLGPFEDFNLGLWPGTKSPFGGD